MPIFEHFWCFSHVFQEEWSKSKLLVWKCRYLNTSLCRKGTVYSLCLRKPQFSISFFSVIIQVLLPAWPRGVLRWWQKEEGAEEGYSSSLLLSPAPTLTTPSLSPRKMSVFLLMLQQRCPSCSFRAKSRATRPGSSVLCIDHYAQSEWLYPGRVRPQVRLVGKYHTFSLPGDRITFGKCRKKE